MADAILYGNYSALLAFNQKERPLALQLGGNNPKALAQCATIAEAMGYDEVNINAGCPSSRVRHGNFGACLISQPELLADCVRSMKDSCSLPVTVKTRIAIDQLDPIACLNHLADKLADADVDSLIIHARKAWMDGLDPKANRTIPPLDYDRVYRLKRDYKNLEIVINGGIADTEDVISHLKKIDGVMCGREVVRRPFFLQETAQEVYDIKPRFTRKEIVRLMLQHALDRPYSWKQTFLAMLGLYHGLPRGKMFRRILSEAESPLKAAKSLENLGFA